MKNILIRFKIKTLFSFNLNSASFSFKLNYSISRLINMIIIKYYKLLQYGIETNVVRNVCMPNIN